MLLYFQLIVNVQVAAVLDHKKVEYLIQNAYTVWGTWYKIREGDSLKNRFTFDVKTKYFVYKIKFNRLTAVLRERQL